MKPLVVIPVGVIIERHKAASKWIDYTWRPIAVMDGQPETAPWTLLREEGEVATFFAGMADIDLHPGDTTSYRDNLSSAEPKIWVVLRPTGVDPPYDVVRVTADGSEGESYFSAGEDIVEAVPMPDRIRATIDAFVAQHHTEKPFFKRKRNRADPEALARRGVVDEPDK